MIEIPCIAIEKYLILVVPFFRKPAMKAPPLRDMNNNKVYARPPNMMVNQMAQMAPVMVPNMPAAQQNMTMQCIPANNIGMVETPSVMTPAIGSKPSMMVSNIGATPSNMMNGVKAKPSIGFGIQAQPSMGFGIQAQPSMGFGMQAKPSMTFGPNANQNRIFPSVPNQPAAVEIRATGSMQSAIGRSSSMVTAPSFASQSLTPQSVGVWQNPTGIWQQPGLMARQSVVMGQQPVVMGQQQMVMGQQPIGQARQSVSGRRRHR